MTWSQDAWQEIEPIFADIIAHPFIQALIDGTLEKDKFVFYLQQDSLYLSDFSRVLAGLAVKSELPGETLALLGFAHEACGVERELHRSFLKNVSPAEPTPCCLLYPSFHYRQLATAPLERCMAAVLPCVWIYGRDGEHILAQGRLPQNPFQAWIDTYGGEEYAKSVALAVDIADEMASGLSRPRLLEMTETFKLASKMEWMFWDSAWRLQKWPV
jgi:thiaminase/transcriptional activator TenA